LDFIFIIERAVRFSQVVNFHFVLVGHLLIFMVAILLLVHYFQYFMADYFFLNLNFIKQVVIVKRINFVFDVTKIVRFFISQFPPVTSIKRCVSLHPFSFTLKDLFIPHY